jgi:hypothetical protein
MSETKQNRLAQNQGSPGSSTKSKRPYAKPAFQHEKVFETMALACGKIAPTQGSCHFNRKNS